MLFWGIGAASIENGIVSEPEVECGVDGIAFSVRTQRPFHGRLYVQVFVTEIDQAYRIRCFFIESVKSIETALDVSQLTTRMIDQQFLLPSCSYHLRESRDGPFVRFAHVGDHVTHVWHCDNVAGYVYGMLIHSCHVDDGHGNRVQLIDDNGCVLDHLLVSDIEYDSDVVTAFAETHVFKYADKIQLFFTCTVQLCFKNDGGCENITPPICPDTQDPTSETSLQGSFPDSPFGREDRPPGKEEKQFFGPIDVRDEIAKQLRFTPPPPPLPHLKDSPLNDSEIEFATTFNATRSRPSRSLQNVLEGDLSTDVIVLPRFEPSSLIAASEHNNYVNGGKEDTGGLCISSSDAFMLLMASALAFAASCFTMVLLYRSPARRQMISSVF
ncbi:Cuticlin-1 [Toxocara canis]|uniref:Cuticlin-1 n=1 Tax=Toxocara canis TaxID=6265 RepID=A0A0B2V5K7_TOXCA|nr:Cuticlin-1 [Toxocara canis]